MIPLPPVSFDKEQPLLGCCLSNGRYVSLITPAGTGFATCGGVGLTRWSGDFTEDSEGWFIYVRGLEANEPRYPRHRCADRPRRYLPQ